MLYGGNATTAGGTAQTDTAARLGARGGYNIMIASGSTPADMVFTVTDNDGTGRGHGHLDWL